MQNLNKNKRHLHKQLQIQNNSQFSQSQGSLIRSLLKDDQLILLNINQQRIYYYRRKFIIKLSIFVSQVFLEFILNIFQIQALNFYGISLILQKFVQIPVQTIKLDQEWSGYKLLINSAQYGMKYQNINEKGYDMRNHFTESKFIILQFKISHNNAITKLLGLQIRLMEVLQQTSVFNITVDFTGI
ncbi:hypothetical protein pb186bvf_004974 [Paramecium bursaria]